MTSALPRLLKAALLASLALSPRFIQASEPPAAPILRIDPGEHTTTIRRISGDAAGRWLVTAGDDKAARVWDLAGGRLLTTLRPAIGTGNEGKLNAVAMSPDGQIVALGGWTQFNEGSNEIAADGNTIYLFDRASGRMLSRIANLPNVVQHLAYSPDGRMLAATLFGSYGLRLYTMPNGNLFGEDPGYGGDSYSVQFSPDGRRLMTTSYDGNMRLYRIDSAGLTLLLKKSVPGGKILEGARFSPDGRQIAVGFDDSHTVNVLDSTDLRLLYAPDTRNVDAKLSSIAWSRDGAWLYAAGQAQRQFNGQWQDYIRRWPVRDGRTGQPENWPVAGDVIMDLLPLPDGRLAFASGAPAWGVMTAMGQRRLFHAPAVADFRGNDEGFTLSADASQVHFGYELWGKAPAVFDSQARAMIGTTGKDLLPPRSSAPGLEISDWKHSPNPRLNGQPITLYPYEQARCVAVRPDDNGFVLGASWSLRSYDREGKLRWLKPVPGTTWSVNVAADGRWVVAAYGDGTIRWHRASDGAELMAFYPHPDKKRWVLWTPSGYYDASPGAEDLIGWHVNNGKSAAADFFPASRFRDRFYRPDVLARVLDTQDEAEAVRLANAEGGRRAQSSDIANVLPPVLRLVAPVDGERFTQAHQVLRYTVRTAADAPVQSVKVLLDGRPIAQGRGLQIVADNNGEEFERSLEITLPERDVTLSVVAENKHGASVAQSVRLAWAGVKNEPFIAKPRLYVLAVGVSDYQDKTLKLTYPAKDAQDFADVFKQQSAMYRDVVTKVLADPTAAEVLDGLDWLRGEVTAKDVGVLFLAGHGVNDADGDYYFLPRDANPARLRRTAVPYFEVKKTLSSLPGKTLAFIDTCHSGSVMGARRGVADITAVINDLTAAENGVVVFASSTGRQFSLESQDWRNGAFTKALVEGLSGKADYTHDGAVTINELDTWLADRVKQLTHNQQTPTTTKPNTVQDFPVAVVR
jgi:hypothetical protein